MVRYDSRDTGRSTSYPPGSPGYTSADLVNDPVVLLDALEINRAHVVGLSLGGGIAQRLALVHRDRVAALTLMSTSPIDSSIEGLPGPSAEIQKTFSHQTPEPDWEDQAAVVDYIVEGERPYAGPGNFDESRMRSLALQVFNRTNDIAASMTNHFMLDDGPSAVVRLRRLAGLATLVVHGTDDPLFPVAHGRALADAIPGAQLLELEGVGHQFPPRHTWDLLVDALTEITTRS